MDVGRAFRAVRIIRDEIRCRLRIFYLGVAYPSVQLGENIFLGNCVLLATDGGTMGIGGNSSVASLVRIESKGGAVDKGANSFIGQGAIIVSCSEISIGVNALIAEYVTIRDQDHEFESDGPTTDGGMRTAPIRIGRNVWIGAKATITRGVSIGDNAVIGANAVVTRDVPENAVACGVPAKIMRLRGAPA